MPYHQHKIGMSEDQAKKLLKNLAVRLKHEDLSKEDVPIELTSKHMRDMGKALQSGKGYVLRISPTHHRRLVKGAGFWSDLWGKIKSVAGKVAKAAQHPIVRKAAKIAVDLPVVKEGLEQLSKRANDVSTQINPKFRAGDVIKDTVANYTSGSGVRRPRGRRGTSFLLQ